MQIVSNLHEMSKSVFCEKKKEKNISNMSSTENFFPAC